MNLRLDDLRRGIRWWRREKDKWPQDFHNNVYYDLYDLRRDGLTEGWWRSTVDRLWDWKAIRPKTKREIQNRGLEILGELQNLYVNIATRTDHEPLFLDFIWNEIHEFYDRLSWIKNVASPNFSSKLGHVIFPKLFGVMDNEATGIKNYGLFWSSMSAAWNRFEDKQDAKAILTRGVTEFSTRPVNEDYPFEIKIIELCSIGRKHMIA